jgi:hypothetical protein
VEWEQAARATRATRSEGTVSFVDTIRGSWLRATGDWMLALGDSRLATAPTGEPRPRFHSGDTLTA